MAHATVREKMLDALFEASDLMTLNPEVTSLELYVRMRQDDGSIRSYNINVNIPYENPEDNEPKDNNPQPRSFDPDRDSIG